jgi:2-dehydro-3-deoxygluconokinase
MSGGLVTCGETMACLASRDVAPLRLGGDLRLTIAGAESNVAIGVARLGHSATWIGRVGDDELGELVLRTLRAEGVDVRRARRDGTAPTGLMVKERRVAAVTRVHYYRAGSAGSRLHAGDVDAAVVADAALVHVTGITRALGPEPAGAVAALIAAARSSGVAVAVDVNFRARLWPSREKAALALRALAREGDYVLAGADELALIGADERASSGGHASDGDAAAVAELLDGRARAVVVSRGAAGAEVHTAEGVVRRPAPAVTAVDTVGAGDALTAGFLSGLLDGLDPCSALERGVRAAAFAVCTAGDWEGLPTRAELGLLTLDEGATVR